MARISIPQERTKKHQFSHNYIEEPKILHNINRHIRHYTFC